MKNIITIILLYPMVLFSQNNSNIDKIQFESECVGVELDGSQTIKAWGSGKNYSDASEQAKKNAVHDVIFKGIKKGTSECSSLPLIMNQSDKFKYEEYFNTFFADGGKYKKFVNTKDERNVKKITRGKSKNNDQITHNVIVRVMRSELKKQLIADGIIKQ